MDGWTDTRGGNVLINGRAPPPLPRGRINIFGCSTTRGRRQCRDREGGRGWVDTWMEEAKTCCGTSCLKSTAELALL